MVKDLAQKLKLDPNDIENARRVGQENLNNKRPKIVLVTLSSKHARDQWIAVKKDHKITNNTVYSNGSNNKVFINESLPKYKRQLLWMVRNTLKPMGYQYIWVQNGNILAKRSSEEKKIYNIRSEQDLNKFEGNK